MRACVRVCIPLLHAFCLGDFSAARRLGVAEKTRETGGKSFFESALNKSQPNQPGQTTAPGELENEIHLLSLPIASSFHRYAIFCCLFRIVSATFLRVRVCACVNQFPDSCLTPFIWFRFLLFCCFSLFGFPGETSRP